MGKKHEENDSEKERDQEGGRKGNRGVEGEKESAMDGWNSMERGRETNNEIFV